MQRERLMKGVTIKKGAGEGQREGDGVWGKGREVGERVGRARTGQDGSKVRQTFACKWAASQSPGTRDMPLA